MNLKKLSKPLFITGLVAGTLDCLAAVIMYYVQTGKDPMNVFRFIASGVFGTTAFSGGIPIALCGIAFHYVIAFGWTALFFWLALRAGILTRNWIISGILYGIFIWLMMNQVIVPLSMVPLKPGPKEWADSIIGAIIIIICVGLPVAFLARKYININK